MKGVIVFISLFLFLTEGYCADTTSVFIKKHTIYIELGGKLPSYSVNYDKVFRQRHKLAYSYSVGISLTRNDLGIPFSINAFTTGFKHHFEFGLGATFYIEDYKTFLHKPDYSDKQAYIVPSIGYRYQKKSGGLFLTAGLSPQIFIDPPSYGIWRFTPIYRLTGHLAVGVSF